MRQNAAWHSGWAPGTGHQRELQRNVSKGWNFLHSNAPTLFPLDKTLHGKFRMLTLEESGSGVYRNSLYYLGNFSVNLILFPQIIYLFIQLCQVLGLMVYGIFSCHVWDLVPQDHRSNPGPLHWELGVLATGPPGKYLFQKILRVLTKWEFSGRSVIRTLCSYC